MEAGQLENEIYDLLGRPVGKTEVYARDGHEADDDCSGLSDVTPVGPLYSLQLGPAGSQEGNRAPVDRLRGLGDSRRLLGFRSRSISEGFLGGLRSGAATPSTPSTAGRNEIAGWCLELAVAVLGLDLLLERDPTGPPDERRVELVDIARM